MRKIAVIIVDSSLKGWWKEKEKSSSKIRKEEVRQNIKAVMDKAREKKIPLIFVDDGFQATERTLERHFKLFGPHAIEGTEFAEPDELLEPDPETDFVVKKRTYAGFFQTRLDSLLRELGVETIVFMGQDTDACVQHTVMGAFFRGYENMVVEDGCTCPSWERQTRGIEYMKRYYDSRIVTTKEILEQFEAFP